MKVLIADPDWRFSEQAARYLEDHAHLVVQTTRASDAKARAEHWQPDLVIMEADLANKGLMEAIYELKPRPAVLLTGWMDRYDRAWRAWQKGGDELLMKPLLRKDEFQLAVVSALENAVAGQRRRAAATA